MVGENIDRVWITDFGLARAADSVTLTRTGVIAGTPHYMSPEQARGEAVDHRSDLFSLGCVLYFLCTGSPPFDAENTLDVLHKIVSQRAAPLAALRDDLPPSFVVLVHQLLHRSPEKRPADCEAVIEDIGTAQAELHEGRRAKPPLSPRRRIVLLAGAACILVALLGAISIWKQPQRTRITPNGPQSSGIAVNPWSNSNTNSLESGQDASPYIAHASQQIDNAVAIDTEQFRQVMGDMGTEGDSPDDLFRRGLQRAIQSLKKANAEEEREVLRGYVRTAFSDRYDKLISDRKKDLEKLKQSVARLESDLKRREAAKDRVVQLQLQSVQLAAEGLLELGELQGVPAGGAPDYGRAGSGDGRFDMDTNRR